MKLLLILLLSFTLQVSNETQIHFEEKGIINVKLDGVQTEKGGKIYIALFNRKGDYMTENRFKGLIVDVDEYDKTDVSFTDLPKGEYAVTAFHDTNGNGKMDFDPSGMPEEDWASSGTPNPYGPPTWESTKIQLNNESVNVKLNFNR